MQREPLKKLNDTPKFKEKIRLCNKAIEEIITKPLNEYNHITALNKLIYATVAIIQDTIVLPAPEINKQK